jgi:drug/metabolite transporter (DMT)-like permease
VGPSNANLVYSLQPIFTAVFAFVLLGESMDPMGFVGGGLILAAVMLVASGPMDNKK